MCTILCVPGTIDRAALLARLRADATYNSDGVSILTIDASGSPTRIQSLDLAAAESHLYYGEWERAWIHMRAATQGAARLSNVHAWSETTPEGEEIVVMHNGILRAAESSRFDVDSQLILAWLRREGLDETTEKLQGEPFANVFLVNLTDGYFVLSRSQSGSLYTDGEGAYSTNPVADITQPVAHQTVRYHWFRDEEYADVPMESDLDAEEVDEFIHAARRYASGE
jgi:hypothetical protein